MYQYDYTTSIYVLVLYVPILLHMDVVSKHDKCWMPLSLLIIKLIYVPMLVPMYASIHTIRERSGDTWPKRKCCRTTPTTNNWSTIWYILMVSISPNGRWYMVYGIWYMVYGIWYMVYGIWYMVNGTWYISL